jgi:hypothetical protein
MRDRQDQGATTIDIEIGEDGSPACCRADRPRMAGKQTILTPWSGSCLDFREHEGLRLAARLEATWQLPEGPFTYFRVEVTKFELLRD